MLYKIDWLEVKTTSTGKYVKKCVLLDESGVKINDVSIWGDFPNWDELRPGSEVKGEIKTNDKGYKSLYPEKVTTSRAPSGVKAAQERKAVMIEEAQNRKNDSIAYFNSLNSAITFVDKFRSEFEIQNSEDAFEIVLTYRDKFLDEWQSYSAKDITDKRKPW